MKEFAEHPGERSDDIQPVEDQNFSSPAEPEVAEAQIPDVDLADEVSELDEPDPVPSGPPPEAVPISASERVGLIDSFRGFAIFGILAINIWYFAYPTARLYGFEPEMGLVHQAVHHVVFFFAKAKFYLIFSMLFGLGMAVQYDRMIARGRKFSGFYAKRLFWLLCIGLFHGCFLWSGDILTNYALTGFLLLLFANRKPKTLLIWAGSIYTLLLGGMIIGYTVMKGKERTEGPLAMIESMIHREADSRELFQNSVDLLSHGSYLDSVGLRTSEMIDKVQNAPQLGFFLIVAFLLGAAFWKLGLFQDVSKHRNTIKRMLLYCGAVGLFGNYFFTDSQIHHLAGADFMIHIISLQITQYCLAVSYLCALALLYEAGRAGWLFNALAPVGRMALTNYLTHSVFFTLLFNGYGLGLMGKVQDGTGFLLTLAMFTFQIYFSKWWLARFRFGPAEWLWRSLTYGKLQPMRRMPDGVMAQVALAGSGA